MKICFYSEGHIGDLLLQLPLIDILIKSYPENEYYYYSLAGQNTILDESLIQVVNNLFPTSVLNGDINIPTWFCNPVYDQFRGNLSPENFFPDYFSMQKYFFPNILKTCGFEIEVPDDCGIDFEYTIPSEVKESVEKYKNTKNKNVILFNQTPRSGQTDANKYAEYLIEISVKYPEYNFFYTNDEGIELNLKNLHYTPDIFGRYKCDILYNAYLSNYCRYICGRVSGPYMFSSMHNMNVLDNEKIIVSQINSHMGVETFYNKKIYKAKNIQSASTADTFKILNREILGEKQ
jgi:hypothetical protein